MVRLLSAGVAHPEVLQPPLDLVGSGSQLVTDTRGLAADPREDEICDKGDGGDDQQKDQKCAQRPRQPVSVEPVDQLNRHGCDHAGDHQRNGDHRSQREKPDDPDEQDHDPDQEPGREPRVPKPARGGEQTRELARIYLDELILFLTLGAVEAAKAAADHRPFPFMMRT